MAGVSKKRQDQANRIRKALADEHLRLLTQGAYGYNPPPWEGINAEILREHVDELEALARAVLKLAPPPGPKDNWLARRESDDWVRRVGHAWKPDVGETLHAPVTAEILYEGEPSLVVDFRLSALRIVLMAAQLRHALDQQDAATGAAAYGAMATAHVDLSRALSDAFLTDRGIPSYKGDVKSRERRSTEPRADEAPSDPRNLSASARVIAERTGRSPETERKSLYRAGLRSARPIRHPQRKG